MSPSKDPGEPSVWDRLLSRPRESTSQIPRRTSSQFPAWGLKVRLAARLEMNGKELWNEGVPPFEIQKCKLRNSHAFVPYGICILLLACPPQSTNPLFPVVCVWSLVKSCLTLSSPVDCSPPGSSVHGIFQQGYWSRLPFTSLGW